MKKIYIAGPDVFRQDAKSWAEDIRQLVASFGFEALLPTDNDKTDPLSIYIANCNLIRQCDIVLANVNEFRGIEPDSGTCFELGYAAALDKQIVMYLSDTRPLIEKVYLSLYGFISPTTTTINSKLDINGYDVEDFDLPLNLMLACSGKVIYGNIHQALKYIKDYYE
jgi:nucleoside 2-deoxyribosyltransferase